MIDYRRASAGVALLSGVAAVIVAFGVSSRPSSHSEAFAMAAMDAGRATGAPDDASHPDVHTATAAAMPTGADVMAKADRLAVTFGRVSAITASNGPDAGLAAFTITTDMPDQQGTVAMPLLAFASLDPGADAETAIARMADPYAYLPDRGLRNKPIETPPVAEEEEDDVPIAAPLPRPRPEFTEHGLPMPRLKPHVPAPSAPMELAVRVPESKPGAILQPGMAPPGVAIPDPSTGRPQTSREGKQNNTILAYLGNESTAPTAPSDRSKIILNTPFGVPFVPQTASVETACLRPELIDILRQIEHHYGKKVVITSGQRSRGRPGSLHRMCAAADIVVPGVDAKSLATYARTIPSVGGVGSYCHPEMIHVDVGTPRDWKYGCGSYFAMRDGSAHWGKAPAGMGME